ncbi:MAG: hypothetical protein R3B48_21745 [Kofleriaceae bacterium]
MSELVRQVESPSVTNQSRYFVKRKFWSIFDRIFRVFTVDGQLILYVKHPIFRFREEFTIWADEHETRPVFKLKSRQIIAINFCFDIIDAATGSVVATIQKRGLKSLVRDTFLILDPSGNQIGTMEEHGHSILRRILPILTSKHELTINGRQVAFVRQLFRFFTREFQIDLQPSAMDPRLVLACALLAIIAEARRESGGGWSNLLSSG